MVDLLDIITSTCYEDSCLPPTKIRRQYKCPVKECDFTTTNPRQMLYHRQIVHDDKIKIVKCQYCIYACQHRQKLTRHIDLVHKDRLLAKNSLIGVNDVNSKTLKRNSLQPHRVHINYGDLILNQLHILNQQRGNFATEFQNKRNSLHSASIDVSSSEPLDLTIKRELSKLEFKENCACQ